MNIRKYFSYHKDKGFHIYILNEADTKCFLATITDDFRHCYINDSDLKEKAVKSGVSEGYFLEQYVLPCVGKIKSGDFGEMFSLFFIQEHYVDKGFLIFCPYKWLWREDRNKASPYTDVVGFYRDDKENPSEKDFLVSVESKMKATRSSKHRMQEAVDGANKDRLTRLAKTLGWLRDKYGKDGEPKKRMFVERYLDPVGTKSYTKFYNALVILDRTFAKNEIDQPVKGDDGIAITVIIMDNLKDIYEDNLKRIIASV